MVSIFSKIWWPLKLLLTFWSITRQGKKTVVSLEVKVCENPWLNQLISDTTVCRTALATLVLLNIITKISLYASATKSIYQYFLLHFHYQYFWRSWNTIHTHRHFLYLIYLCLYLTPWHLFVRNIIHFVNFPEIQRISQAGWWLPGRSGASWQLTGFQHQDGAGALFV